MNKIVNKYSNFVSNHPFLMILLVLIFSAAMFSQFGNIKFENQGNDDMLPDGIEAIEEFDFINNEFQGTESIHILIKIDPSVPESTQPRDIRESDVIAYVDDLSQRLLLVDDVISIGSASNTIKKMNDGKLPKEINDIKKFSPNLVGNTISGDYQTTLITINLEGTAKGDALYNQVTAILDTTEKPSKLHYELSGEKIQDVVMEATFGPDMARTSNFALIGILVVIMIIFRSIKYGLTPLSTILFANLWAFGMLGFLRMPITSVMTGVSSMIMGIGIDFGIQVVYRFKYEMKTKEPSEAMNATLNNVILPMSTTTLAALIGFRAMSLGELTMMANIGTMMTYGVLFSMIAALTFVPAILVIGEKYRIRDLFAKKNNENNNRNNKNQIVKNNNKDNNKLKIVKNNADENKVQKINVDKINVDKIKQNNITDRRKRK